MVLNGAAHQPDSNGCWWATCQWFAWALSLGGAALLLASHLRGALVWVESQPGWAALLLFSALFALVSLPCCWGYTALCLAAGYLFGACNGLALIVATASTGLLCAHVLMRHVSLARSTAHALLSRLLPHPMLVLLLLQGPDAFRIVLLARLTPVPFGLQNALFALGQVGTRRYMCATVAGLLPTQALNVYFGSTFRSMQDVLADEATATVGYAVLAIQVCIGVCLMLYVVRKARLELHRTLVLQGRHEPPSERDCRVTITSRKLPPLVVL